MNRARVLRSLCLSFLALAIAASCSSPKDTEDYVPAERGAVQPDGGGPLISEASACTKLKDAESSARHALGCDAVERSCPDYIRPAGGADCFEYDQTSIDGCDTLFQSFKSCDDFALHPCLITAVSKCDEPPAGEAGAGGAPSTPVSEAGSPGAAGESAAGAGGA